MKKGSGARSSKKTPEPIFAVYNFGKGSGVIALRLRLQQDSGAPETLPPSQKKASASHFGNWLRSLSWLRLRSLELSEDVRVQTLRNNSCERERNIMMNLYFGLELFQEHSSIGRKGRHI